MSVSARACRAIYLDAGRSAGLAGGVHPHAFHYARPTGFLRPRLLKLAAEEARAACR